MSHPFASFLLGCDPARTRKTETHANYMVEVSTQSGKYQVQIHPKPKQNMADEKSEFKVQLVSMKNNVQPPKR